jgi:Gas vesicle synthesis protein GvpL/GvpF
VTDRVATARRAPPASPPPANPPNGSLYVYAIVLVPAWVDGLTGLGDTGLGLVHGASTAAVVGPAGADRIRPTRANLLAHQRVVAELHERGPVLPVRFGTVVPGAEEVLEDLLEPEAARHLASLQALDGKDAYRLKVSYLPDVALQEAVAGSRSIRRLRVRLQGAGGRAAPGDQLELGEMVFAELERNREVLAVELLERLGPFVDAVQTIEDGSDEVALNVALLVARAGSARFDDVLDQIGRKEQDRLHFELVGPLPAWDFAEDDAGGA